MSSIDKRLQNLRTIWPAATRAPKTGERSERPRRGSLPNAASLLTRCLTKLCGLSTSKGGIPPRKESKAWRPSHL